MLKLDIATRIHQEAGIPMDEAAQLLEWFHGFLKTTLLAHKPIVIAGFGKFTVRNKHARPGTESSNGRSCDDLGARVVTFHASPQFKTHVNSRSEDDNTAEVDSMEVISKTA